MGRRPATGGRRPGLEEPLWLLAYRAALPMDPVQGSRGHPRPGPALQRKQLPLRCSPSGPRSVLTVMSATLLPGAYVLHVLSTTLRN